MLFWRRSRFSYPVLVPLDWPKMESEVISLGSGSAVSEISRFAHFLRYLEFMVERFRLFSRTGLRGWMYTGDRRPKFHFRIIFRCRRAATGGRTRFHILSRYHYGDLVDKRTLGCSAIEKYASCFLTDRCWKIISRGRISLGDPPSQWVLNIYVPEHSFNILLSGWFCSHGKVWLLHISSTTSP